MHAHLTNAARNSSTIRLSSRLSRSVRWSSTATSRLYQTVLSMSVSNAGAPYLNLAGESVEVLAELRRILLLNRQRACACP